MASWSLSVVTTFRDDKTLMSLMFLLGGYSTVTSPKGSFSWRLAALCGVYFLMGWPLWFASTSEVATFHRWFIMWLAICMTVAKLSDVCVKQLGDAVKAEILVSAFFLAPTLQDVPDKLGILLAGKDYDNLTQSWAALFFNPE